MDRPSIIWSNKAKIKLFKILQFYAERNKSNSFSIKLYQRINKEIRKLRDHPNIGINTDSEMIKALIVDNYLIYYEFTNEYIVIHTIWDSRQNPENLKITQTWNAHSFTRSAICFIIPTALLSVLISLKLMLSLPFPSLTLHFDGF